VWWSSASRSACGQPVRLTLMSVHVAAGIGFCVDMRP